MEAMTTQELMKEISRTQARYCKLDNRQWKARKDLGKYLRRLNAELLRRMKNDEVQIQGKADRLG